MDLVWALRQSTTWYTLRKAVVSPNGGQTLSSWYVAVSRYLDFTYHSNWHDLYKSTVLSVRFLSYRQEKICREGSAIQLAWKCAQTVSTHLLSNRFVSERSEGVVWFFLFRKKHVNSSKLDTAWPTQQSKSNRTIVSHNSNVPHYVPTVLKHCSQYPPQLWEVQNVWSNSRFASSPVHNVAFGDLEREHAQMGSHKQCLLHMANWRLSAVPWVWGFAVWITAFLPELPTWPARPQNCPVNW